jgi:hypothetical protein
MWRTVALAGLLVACSGGEEPHRPAAALPRAAASTTTQPVSEGEGEGEGEGESESESEVEGESESESESDVAPISLHFAWPAPAEADVRVVSEHAFGPDAHVSASYRYTLAVTREVESYLVSRTGIALEAHEGEERLRLGNVLAQDVTQHTGDVRITLDGDHVTAVSGFDPIDAAARAVLAQASIDGTFADAILQLDREGWQALATIDLDSMVHEWRDRSLALGDVEPATALPGVEATRVLRARHVACGEGGAETCVELVRMEQGTTGHGHLEHVYVLLADPETLRPYRFEHEARTVDRTRAVDYSERWVTTFDWR